MARKSRGKRKRRGLSKLVAIGAVAAAVVAGIAALYVVYLDRFITTTFEGRRWSIPARVYAEPVALYLGRALRPEDLTLELRRLGYRPGTEQRAGMFARDGNAVHFRARRFAFDDGVRQETDCVVRFAGGVIVAIEAGGKSTELFNLDAPLIGSFFQSHGEDRIIVTPDETPRVLSEGLKIVEDRNFDHHVGFDASAMLRAAWVDLRTGELEQGGSTLTQQLVKSYFLDNSRTVTRKLKELVMAVILDARFPKADLLNAYINEIFLGQDGGRAVHGFGLGSQFYFNKPLSELEPSEIALLIAVIRGPTYYNPFTHPERALARRNRVLDQMHEFALLSDADYRTALARPLNIATGARRGGSYYPAYLDLLRAQLASSYDASDLATKGLSIFTTLEPRVQDAAESAVAATLDVLEHDRKLPHGELESAVVVTRTQTGEVSALVGGRQAGFQGFNRALNARRPVGSIFKPVVYLTALESGQFDLSTIVDDAPIVVPDAHVGDWTPKNYDDTPKGPVPVVRALGDSLNLATVHVGLAIGVERVAKRIGELLDIPAPEPFPSLLLGAIDLTPIEVARLYGVFASGGFGSLPKSIISVEDETGKTLKRYPIAVKKAAEPDTVTLLDHGLQAVMLRGTGEHSRWSGHGVAGKTGTTDDYRDSWFAGFDANYLTVVWVGYDDNRPTGLSGSAGALPVWDKLMATLHPEALSLGVPYGTELQSIDYATGMTADSSCGDPLQLPLPYNVHPPQKPGCGSVLENFTDRLKRWFSD